MVECRICERTFAKDKNLITHILAVHDKARPYFCHFCTSRFGSAERRTTHEIQQHGLVIEGESLQPDTESSDDLDEDADEEVDSNEDAEEDDDTDDEADSNKDAEEDEQMTDVPEGRDDLDEDADDEDDSDENAEDDGEMTDFPEDNGDMTEALEERDNLEDDVDDEAVSDKDAEEDEEMTDAPEEQSNTFIPSPPRPRHFDFLNPLRDAATDVITMYSSRGFSYESDAVKGTLAGLSRALCGIRKDPTVSTSSIWRARLARLHGRWLVMHERFVQSCNDIIAKESMQYAVDEIHRFSFKLEILWDDEEDDDDDLERFDEFLTVLYGEESVFFEDEGGKVVGPLPQRAVDVLALLGLDEHGAALPPIDETIGLQDKSDVQQENCDEELQADAGAEISGDDQEMQDQDGELSPEAPLADDTSSDLASPGTPPQATAVPQATIFAPQMFLTGNPMAAKLPRSLPATLSPAQNQSEPRTAMMIGDLLNALPRNQFLDFGNQASIMSLLHDTDGIELQIPYETGAPFACDACKIGFPTLDLFIGHLHMQHFLGPTPSCHCSCCVAMFGADKIVTTGTIIDLTEFWWASCPNAFAECAARENGMPAVPTTDAAGEAITAPRTLTEMSQDEALRGLWGCPSIYDSGERGPADGISRPAITPAFLSNLLHGVDLSPWSTASMDTTD
ncbi:hydrogen peroxide stress regulator 1 [Elsinoe australis]|uniref:Hydrogen peroxide stress regulator 1 n=1 Tax=Elsinoe australis TaxID=40998 RepID=A0A2P7Z4E3_9PEZI|nr:hydrogen peroxide stress regulator 1 [Elsinoe australis]